MRTKLLFTLLLTATTMMAQINKEDPNDLWTRTVDVTLGDNWRQKTITIPGKDTPNVLDFYRAFAKAYPCEYHDLLTRVLDGDTTVKFNHAKPYIEFGEDNCYLSNGSFSMRVFYDDEMPAALGVCCHHSLSTEYHDVYYYRYDKATRKLKPLALGSDFTGGIVKRETVFSSSKHDNAAKMVHNWGRCGVENQLVWKNGKFELKDPTKETMELTFGRKSAESLLQEVISRYEMELRDPKPVVETEDGLEICGGSYNSLPICIAIRDPKTATDHYVTASAMEGFYYFTARSWDRPDGSLLVAIYTECAPRMDYYKNKDENGNYVHSPHLLAAGDEVDLSFYVCFDNNMVLYMDPAMEQYPTVVGKGLPSLSHNEWRCVLSPDTDDIVFVSETDGSQMVFKWDGKMFKKL